MRIPAACWVALYWLPVILAHGPQYAEEHGFERTRLKRRGEEHQSRRLSAAEEHGIRISLFTDALPADLPRRYLIDDLLEAAIRWVRLVVKVPPVVGNLKFEKQCRYWQAPWEGVCQQVAQNYQQCGETIIPEEHFADKKVCATSPEECTVSPGGAGVENSDFALYVTARTTTNCGEKTLAYSTHCRQDGSDRPIAGAINICQHSQMVQEGEWHVNVATLVHEIFHALAFSPALYPWYRDESGNPLSPRDWLGYPQLVNNRYVASENTLKEELQEDGTTKYFIVLPKVLDKAKEYYACNDIEKLLLEEHGGDGSQIAHWDQRSFYSEVMTLETQNFPRVSPMTLAMLESSGWYKVDYAYAGAFHFGQKRGCEFLTEQCVKNGYTSYPDTFCTNTDDVGSCPGTYGPVGCTSGRMGKAKCNNCRHSELPMFQYFPDKYLGADRESMSNCPVWEPVKHAGEFVFCQQPDSRVNLATRQGEVYGPSSRCVISSAIQEAESARDVAEGSCHEIRCEGTGAKIRVGDAWVTCNAEDAGRQVDAPDGFSGSVQCPEIHSVCDNQMPDGGACYFPGTVQSGRCVCPPGSVGADCSRLDRLDNRDLCPHGLQYPQVELRLQAGVDVADSVGVWSWPVRPFLFSGTAALTYSATPKLPEGLTLLSDGTIAGRPGAATERSLHVVTGKEESGCAATTTLYVTVDCAPENPGCQQEASPEGGMTSAGSGSTGPTGADTLVHGELPLWRFALNNVLFRDVQQKSGIASFSTDFAATMSSVLNTSMVVVYIVELPSLFLQVEAALRDQQEVGNFTAVTAELLSMLESGSGELTRTEFGAQYLHSVEVATVTTKGILHHWPPYEEVQSDPVVPAEERDATVFATATLFFVTLVLTCFRPEERITDAVPCGKFVLHIEALVQGVAFLGASVLLLMHLQPGENGELSFAMSGWKRWQVSLLQIACVLFVAVIVGMIYWWMREKKRNERGQAAGHTSIEENQLSAHRDSDTYSHHSDPTASSQETAIALSCPLINSVAMFLVVLSTFSKVMPELRKRNPEYALQLEGWQKVLLWTSAVLVTFSTVIAGWDHCRNKSPDGDEDEMFSRRRRLLMRAGSIANLVATSFLLLIATSKLVPALFEDVPAGGIAMTVVLIVLLALGALVAFLFFNGLARKRSDCDGQVGEPLPSSFDLADDGDVHPTVLGQRGDDDDV
mmetsp:Transcript_45023/g.104261  ORF Transcript_45023/g.104261 Transcript_45023/m.104261 type:complete len:1196 (+) Transcript_45023:74-3661(+)